MALNNFSFGEFVCLMLHTANITLAGRLVFVRLIKIAVLHRLEIGLFNLHLIVLNC